MRQIHTQQKKRKIIIWTAALLAVIVLAVGLFFVINAKLNQPKTTGTTDSSGIDLSPATKQETEDSNNHKTTDVQNEKASTEPPQNTKKSVAPVIVDAGQYGNQIEVRAYVPGIVENGGECTAQLTMGSMSITKKVVATGDASTSQCARVVIPKEEMMDGTWSIVVSYSSAAAEGSSQARNVEVK